MRAFRFLTAILTIAFFVTGVIYLIARTIGQILSWDPESRAFKRFLDGLRARLREQSGELVPWDAEMTALLSLNRTDERKPGWFNSIASGRFTSIYHEPVVGYAFVSSGKVRVAIARTSNREFILRFKGRETEIWLNNEPFGVFVDGALLGPGKNPKLLARLDVRPDEAQSPLILGNAAAVTLSNPDRSSSPNPRALTLLRDLNSDEENITLALTFQQLLSR